MNRAAAQGADRLARGAAVIDRYLRRRRLCGPRISRSPPSGLGIVVVIPCRDEPDLVTTLESLAACDPPECELEVLVVVNASATDGPEIAARNRRTLREGRRWRRGPAGRALPVHFLSFPALPPRDAGVGLARKLGMDEAADRLRRRGAPDGVVLCLDADCVCDRNYLRAVEDHFRRNPDTPGCSIYFEHPLAGELDARLYEAVAHYELFLRYHVHGLRHARLPFAYHTVGSSMATRASAYASEGGMNRRQAGEDFYFLHKLIALGGFTEINGTRVVPSPRASSRVPFGTGRAMNAWLDDPGAVIGVGTPRAYRDLAALVEAIDCPQRSAHDARALLETLPPKLAEFLDRCGCAAALDEIRRHTATRRTFRARFFRWMNAFRAMKYLHFARDRGYGTVPVADAARTLLGWIEPDRGPADVTVTGLLARYRELDRSGCGSESASRGR